MKIIESTENNQNYIDIILNKSDLEDIRDYNILGIPYIINNEVFSIAVRLAMTEEEIESSDEDILDDPIVQEILNLEQKVEDF